MKADAVPIHDSLIRRFTHPLIRIAFGHPLIDHSSPTPEELALPHHHSGHQQRAKALTTNHSRPFIAHPKETGAALSSRRQPTAHPQTTSPESCREPAAARLDWAQAQPHQLPLFELPTQIAV
jgi:hypothetical protein